MTLAIAECPDDEVATRQLMELGARGDVRTVTLKALAEQEFAEVVRGLPQGHPRIK